MTAGLRASVSKGQRRVRLGSARRRGGRRRRAVVARRLCVTSLAARAWRAARRRRAEAWACGPTWRIARASCIGGISPCTSRSGERRASRASAPSGSHGSFETPSAPRHASGAAPFASPIFRYQADHIHAIIEADERVGDHDDAGFSRSMRSFVIRLALRINKLLGRKRGHVWGDRFPRARAHEPPRGAPRARLPDVESPEARRPRRRPHRSVFVRLLVRGLDAGPRSPARAHVRSSHHARGSSTGAGIAAATSSTSARSPPQSALFARR